MPRAAEVGLPVRTKARKYFKSSQLKSRLEFVRRASGLREFREESSADLIDGSESSVPLLRLSCAITVCGNACFIAVCSPAQAVQPTGNQVQTAKVAWRSMPPSFASWPVTE